MFQVNPIDLDRIKRKMLAVLAENDAELQAIGHQAAEAIVQSTLDGRAAGDAPFAPYSEAYTQILERYGGKSGVDLRGIIPKGGGSSRRTAAGPLDPSSEMSSDLIICQPDPNSWSFTLTYAPRNESYMVEHNFGTGRAPQREWFSVNKADVQHAVYTAYHELLSARVAAFNTP